MGEVAELAADVPALGAALRDLAEPDDEAEAMRRADEALRRVDAAVAARRARKVRRLRRSGRRAFVEAGGANSKAGLTSSPRRVRAGVDYPSAFDDEAPAAPARVDGPEDVATLARVSDAALGAELIRRREGRGGG